MLQEYLLEMSKTLAVIPARLASSRFPNKPLEEILGIPMIVHCFYRAKYCIGIDHLVIATPDEEIFELCKKLDFEVCMTSDNHERATERAGEVVEIYEKQNKYYENVILLQGDEPQLDPKVVDQLIQRTKISKNGIVNLIHCITERDFNDLNVVKAVINNKNEISVSSGSLNKTIPIIGHIYYKNKKSNLNIIKLKRFSQSAKGYFDKYIHKIK